MATVVVTREDMFPVGTLVSAYELVGLDWSPSHGAPPGPVKESETVQVGGAVTFVALDEGRTYVLYAPSPDRYLRVNTSVTAAAGTGDVSDSELSAAISAHAADSTAVHGIADTAALATSTAVTTAVTTHNADATGVHGISDTASIKGVVVWNSGGVPARPDAFASVEWVGPDDPLANALDGDTWVPTA
jgi:hypothetical protein